MASVDNIAESDVNVPGREVVRAQLTGGTSTYASRRFSTVKSFQATVEGTNATTFTRSGITITITGTNDDWVNLELFGEK